jgi:putative acetyltransferase
VQLPGEYVSPRGAIWLALGQTQVAGCAALRPVDDHTAEIKRVFVRAASRGQGVARRLLTQIINDARAVGYHTLTLETLPAMHAAQMLYGALGFVETARDDEVVRMQLDLRRQNGSAAACAS